MKFYTKPDADIELLEQEDILTISYDRIGDDSNPSSINEDF